MPAVVIHNSKSDEHPQVLRSSAGLEVVQPGLEVHEKPLSFASWVPFEEDDEKPSTTWVAQPQPDVRNERRVLGLRVSTLCLVIALAGAIIAAILAGLLASKTHCPAASTGSSNASTETTTTTITASSPASTSTPSSLCISQANQDWISPISHIKYTRLCNSFLNSSSQNYQNLFTAYQGSLDTCVAMCDSYNYWTNSTEAGVAVWNWAGKSQQTPGTCWCVKIGEGYSVTETEGQDCAVRVGSGRVG